MGQLVGDGLDPLYASIWIYCIIVELDMGELMVVRVEVRDAKIFDPFTSPSSPSQCFVLKDHSPDMTQLVLQTGPSCTGMHSRQS